MGSINAAMAKALPGTAVMVKAGSYVEHVDILHGGQDDKPIWLISADGRGAARIESDVPDVSTISGFGVANLVVRGFEGGSGDDSLDGSSGDDIMAGDAGADVLTGGSGHDSFVLRRGDAMGDRITDFHSDGTEGDTLRLEGYGAGASLVLVGSTWVVMSNEGAVDNFELTGITKLTPDDMWFA